MNNAKFNKQEKKKIIISQIIMAAYIFSFITLPINRVNAANSDNMTSTPAFAEDNSEDTDDANVILSKTVISTSTAPIVKTEKPKKLSRVIVSERKRSISAYNVGDIYQNDDTPCITANGEDVCKALELGYKRCAANFVPFGTILEIDGYGECIVTDRMNSRFPNNVDIAMKYSEKTKAKQFGRRTLTVRIIKYTDIITDNKK